MQARSDDADEAELIPLIVHSPPQNRKFLRAKSLRPCDHLFEEKRTSTSSFNGRLVVYYCCLHCGNHRYPIWSYPNQ